jgi:hypothetical protein
MASRDPRVDAYIKKAAPFAQPILVRLRDVVHRACPDVVEGTKWSSPHFEYKGIFCSMAAFKEHCMFGFWKHALLMEQLPAARKKALGQLDRLASVDDLPSDADLTAIIKAGATLNDEGVKVVRARKNPKPPLKPPAYFLMAVKKNKTALATYDAFSPSNKRDYVEWVTEAKTEETRDRRLAQSVAWMAEGKIRNWKYVSK